MRPSQRTQMEREFLQHSKGSKHKCERRKKAIEEASHRKRTSFCELSQKQGSPQKCVSSDVNGTIPPELFFYSGQVKRALAKFALTFSKREYSKQSSQGLSAKTVTHVNTRFSCSSTCVGHANRISVFMKTLTSGQWLHKNTQTEA